MSALDHAAPALLNALALVAATVRRVTTTVHPRADRGRHRPERVARAHTR